ncbi:MAG: acyl-CoA dehydrogenase family protein [Actinomycetia bacterium]|nr:acyl-CoA dehydrogenase family protein [Actinomycetes bacterium]
MDLDLSADQEEMRDGIRALLAGRFPMARVRGGFEPAMFREIGDAGVFAIQLAEADGGLGLGTADAVVVFEELGRALVPGPLVWTHLAATAGMVAGAADGSRVVGGLTEPESGEPVVLEDLAALDVLLVSSTTGVAAVDPRVLTGVTSDWPLDPVTPVTEVAGLPDGEQVAGPNVGYWCRLQGAALTAAYLLGMADAVTGLAVAYAQERRQFDRVIGSFQAVKHLLADCAVRTEVARAAVYAAGVRLDEPISVNLPVDPLGDGRAAGPPDVSRAVSVAKLLAGEAALANAKTATQVFGGMGFTWEVDVHLYLKRAWVLDTHFGSTDEHADAIAGAL